MFSFEKIMTHGAIFTQLFIYNKCQSEVSKSGQGLCKIKLKTNEMEVFRTEQYYIFTKLNKSLWWNRSSGAFNLKTGTNYLICYTC